MPIDEPFDRSHPSPLRALLALRSSGEESVVATGRTTRRQEAMYVPTGLDDRLRERMLRPDAPSLLLLGGSAGGGKSALIHRLQRELPSGTFTRVIEDATHAEAPDQDQTRLLGEALSGFRAGVPRDGHRVLLAANTGLLLRLERLFRSGGEPGLADLVTFALDRLGVPATRALALDRVEALERSVLVVDLDQRPTSGGEDRLLRRMLAALDPESPDGILAGATRCGTCQVRHFCAPRTNLELLADPVIGAVIDQAVEQVALLRGRDIAPRHLWDGLAELALGGVSAPSTGDPCDTVAGLAAAGNRVAVWRSLLPGGPLAGQGSSALCRDLAGLDPSYVPTMDGHDIIAGSGVDPVGDAEHLLNTLHADGSSRQAVATAADALHDERRELAPGEVARGLVRASWLTGLITPTSAVPSDFTRALAGDVPAIRQVLGKAGDGLVSAFGSHAEGIDYLPTESLSESRSSRILAKVEIGDSLDLQPAVPQMRNPEGSQIVGMRPLTARLLIGNAVLTLDLALFNLLDAASQGTLATSIDIERYHSLRHAAEMLGRRLADREGTPLLILGDGATGAYRVSMGRFRGDAELRISKVG